ncbi:MAG: DNA sulfur modification protein DndB [Parvibaculum sp.]
MNPSQNGMPTPLGTLDDVLDAGDTSEKPMKVFVGHNLGNRTFLMQMPMHEFFGLSEVANNIERDGDTIAQRKLDPAHAHKLALYLLKGLISAAIERRVILKRPENPTLQAFMDRLGRQPYMAVQPLVVNIRNCDPRGTDMRAERLQDSRTAETAAFKVYLAQRHVLWVVDGQHRRRAMQIIFEFLESLRGSRNYPKKGNLAGFKDGEELTAEEAQAWEECFDVARTYCTVLVEVHLGLNAIEERQLFHDLNRLGKKVDTNLALQFDSSNPVNLFIKEQLIDALGMKVIETDVKNWSDDEGGITRKDLVAVNALFFLNKTNISSATPPMVEGKVPLALRFWTAVQAIDGFGEDCAREKTVAAQPVMLKALAKLVFDFSFSNRKPQNGDSLTEALLSGMTEVDFSHTNPVWRFYEMTEEERNASGLGGLVDYLPLEETGNRDIGSFQGEVMRFGAKHNDIYPILGDMIRWQLKLPSRRGPSVSTSSEANAA